MNPFELKAKMLCEGVNPDDESMQLFEEQNPSKVRRGGLSSGGKMILNGNLPVNAPLYLKRRVDLQVIRDRNTARGVIIYDKDKEVEKAKILSAPDWYNEIVDDIPITKIFTAHNNQLATAAYEHCDLFNGNDYCKFCVMNRSLMDRDNRLILKSPELYLKALQKIPTELYSGISINGGMTFSPARGIEKIIPIDQVIGKNYPNISIAVEITPPEDLSYLTKLYQAGCNSLMMNMECWDEELRRILIPGKNKYCPKEQYLRCFEESVKIFGEGKITSCFVVGTESLQSLKTGIMEVIERGVIPSPLSGRFFEDIPNYPFNPTVDYRDFLDIMEFTKNQLSKKGISSTDKAGCVACRMCDMVCDKTT